jgi:hypothetical protein
MVALVAMGYCNVETLSLEPAWWGGGQMPKILNHKLLRLLALVSLLGASAPVFPPTVLFGKAKPVLWRNPGAIEKLDFVGGSGGRSRAPRPPFVFIEEDLGGSSPKIKVKDANGAEWNVKWGEEVNAEIVASRLAWAAGYFVEPSYFLARGKIRGVKGLKRAEKFVASDGSFAKARFELREKRAKYVKGPGWTWSDNPFAGTRELDGLKIVVMLTSNWDTKDARDANRGSNTAIIEYPSGGTEARYLVTDWGASMGRWGGLIRREKWDCEGYAEDTPKFVKGVKNNMVAWGYSGQHTPDITDNISVSDVKWCLQYIGRISDRQISAALRAAGATPGEVKCFSKAIRARINQLKNLRSPKRVTRVKKKV